MNIYSITYTFITIIHNLFWLFVILAFYNKKLAYFNLYIVIPVTYVTHILPFHILERLKEIVKDKDMKIIILLYIRLNGYMELKQSFLQTGLKYNRNK